MTKRKSSETHYRAGIQYHRGRGILCKGTGRKYQLIDSEKRAFPISLLCKVLDVSRSEFYGARRMPKELTAEGDPRGEPRRQH